MGLNRSKEPHVPKPELVEVNVRPNELARGLYELECLYSDGVTLSERWGTRRQTEYAADIRRLDIKSVAPRSKRSPHLNRD
jgi:hypothetical protein